jgi:hypothetical protein
MKFRQVIHTILTITLLLPAGIVPPGASVVSAATNMNWDSGPVSVGTVNSGVGQEMTSPVSVNFSSSGVGDELSKPVSVHFPSSGVGTEQSSPVSVSMASATENGTYMALPAAVSVQTANAGDPDLVGLWHFDGDWGDSSGNNYLGVPYNNPQFSSNKAIGVSSGSFDGVDDYVIASEGYISTASNTFTIEFWANPSSTRATTTESNSGSSGTSGQRYAIYPSWFGNSDAGAGISVGTNGISVFEHAANYLPSLLVYDQPLSGWNHIAVVYVNKQPRLYLNGTLVRTGLTSQRNNVFPSIRFSSDNSYGRYNGLIDEVTVYKRALTAEEIAFHRAAGISDPNAPTAPVLYAVEPVVGSSSVVLSGTKSINTAIWVNNKRVYDLDNQDAWQGTYSGLVPGINYLYVTAVDAAYLRSVPATASLIYDNEPPVIESSVPANNATSAKAVTSISITFKDTYSGIKTTESRQGATVENTNGPVAGSWNAAGSRTIVFTPDASSSLPADTYTVKVYPEDAVGNKASQPQQIVFKTYDTTPPVTKVSLSGTKGLDGWYSTPVQVTLTADDGADGSGIASTEYSIDGTTWLTYAAPFVLDSDGSTTLRYRSTDRAGNVETPDKTSEIKINKTGLVGHWKMDDDNWVDASVAGNNGTAM